MINLLSPVEKKKILKEYHLRLGVVILAGGLLLQVFAFVFLIPSYLSITMASDALAENLAQRKAIVIPGSDEAQKSLDALRKEITSLRETIPHTSLPSALLGEILETKPEGMDVTSFAYGNSPEGVLAQVGGVAGTREDLLFFQRALKSNPRFTDVRYADSFITKKTDIHFQLTLKVK